MVCALCFINSIGGQTIYYIDPLALSPGDGTTTAHPLTDFQGIASNCIYKLKAGSTLYANPNNPYNYIGQNVYNVKVTNYPDGSPLGNPKIIFSGSFKVNGLAITEDPLNSGQLVIENLDIVSYNNFPDQTGDAIEGCNPLSLQCRNVNSTISIKNVNISGGWRGLVLGSNGYNDHIRKGDIIIDNCTINSCQHDAIYLYESKSATITNTKVWNINLGNDKNIGGDCLQTNNVDLINVTNCILDHSNTNGKYCFITNAAVTINILNSSLIGNENQGCIYVDGNAVVTVENSKLFGSQLGIQNQAASLTVKNCIIKDSKQRGIDGQSQSQDIYVYNSDFINMPIAIYSSKTNTNVFNSVFKDISLIENTSTIPKVFDANPPSGNNNFFSSAIPSNYNKNFPATDKGPLDPLFIDNNSDFRIISTSLCKDNGMTLSVLHSDIDGIARPDGFFDIGTYEYSGISDPAKPDPSITNITGTGFTISWTAVNGATNYDVLANEFPVLKDLTTTTAIVTGLNNCTNYSVKVVAKTNSIGSYSVSTPISKATDLDITKSMVGKYTGNSYTVNAKNKIEFLPGFTYNSSYPTYKANGDFNKYEYATLSASLSPGCSVYKSAKFSENESPKELQNSEQKGVSNNTMSDRFSVYPNPTNGILNLELGVDNATIQIYNVYGSIIVTKQVNSQKSDISLGNLPAGTYFIKVSTNKGTHQTTIIKN